MKHISRTRRSAYRVGRIATAAAAFIATLSLSISPAVARTTSSPFAFGPHASQTENCVEQQSGGLENCALPTAVMNPTRCIWTVDQYQIDTALGDLPAGGAATDQMCLIADGLTNWWGEPHYLSAMVTSVKPNLAVKLSDQLGDQWQLQPVTTSKGTTWSLCVPGPTAFLATSLIPGSNGGFGQELDYTLTVQNTTGQTARGVAGQMTLQGTTYSGYGCYWQ